MVYCIEVCDPFGIDGSIMLRSHSSLIALKKACSVFSVFLSSEYGMCSSHAINFWIKWSGVFRPILRAFFICFFCDGEMDFF